MIQTLSLSGLCANLHNGQLVSVQFGRRDIPSDEDIGVQLRDDLQFRDREVFGVGRLPTAYSTVTAPGPPPVPDFWQSTDTSIGISLVLGQVLGKGKTGIVCSVEADGAGAAYAKEVPDSIVVKIAGPVGRIYLAREARLYEDMLSLQGSVIPRCYGYFESVLPAGTTFSAEFEERECNPSYSSARRRV